MDDNERNSFGCPLVGQTGEAGVRNFRSLLRALPPEQRQAFERERAAREAELRRILAAANGTAPSPFHPALVVRR
jgi:hypothetical protein